MSADLVNSVQLLNDNFRKTGIGGRTMITDDVAALPPALVAQAFQAMKAFNDFNADNDPHGEHDCAIFTVGDNRFLFKIDYYDRKMELGSEDPTDPSKTTRVLTLMLASEY